MLIFNICHIKISAGIFILMLYCVYAQSLSHVWFFVNQWTVAHQAPLSMEFSSKNTGMSCHFLFQEIFPTQGSNPHLLHCRQILYHWLTAAAKSLQSCLTLCTLQSASSSVPGISQARILEWVAISSSRGPSRPRDQTHISYIGKHVLYHWAR